MPATEAVEGLVVKKQTLELDWLASNPYPLTGSMTYKLVILFVLQFSHM